MNYNERKIKNMFTKNKAFLLTLLIFSLFLTACTASKPIANAKNNNQNNLTNNKKSMINIDKNSMSNQDILKKYSKAEFKTTMGNFTVEFFNKEMPITVSNFLNLADSGYFDGVKFHRVMENFMIQSGDPLSKDDSKALYWGTGGPGYAIADEFVKGLSNVYGTIAMANSGPNSGGSQFFVNVKDNTFLDFDKEPFTSQHPVFGKVIDGMDVVEKISRVDVVPNVNRPTEPVVIEKINLK